MAGGDWTPSALGTTKCAAWFDASSLSLANGALVSSWTSSEGNSIEATQSNSARQPLFVAESTISGRPAVKFNDAGDFDHLFFTQSSLNVGTSGSLVCCFVGNANDGSTLSFGTITRGSSGSTSIQLLYQNNNSNMQISAGSVSDIVSSSNFTEGTTGTAYRSILFGRFDAKLALRYLGNEISDEADASSINLSGTDYAIGSAYFSGGCEGEIAEIMYLVGATQADIEKVEGYTAWKYGLQTNLPSDHTYRFHKPTIEPKRWQGGVNGVMTNVLNWSGGSLPTAQDKVLFDDEYSTNTITGSLTAGSVFVTPNFDGKIGTTDSPATFTAESIVLGSDEADLNLQLASNTQTFVTSSTNGVKLTGTGTNIFVRSKSPTTLALSNDNTMTIDARHPSGAGGLVSHESGTPLLTRVGFGGALEHSFGGGLDTVEITGNGKYRHTEGSIPSFFFGGGEAVFDGTILSGVSDLLGGVLTLRDSSQPLIEFGVVRVFPGGTMDLTGSAVGQVDFEGSKVISSRGGGKLRLGQGRSVAMS